MAYPTPPPFSPTEWAKLLAYLDRRVSSKEAAQDIAHDAYLAALEQKNLKLSYVWGIAKNLLKQHYRKNRDVSPLPEHLPEQSPSPWEVIYKGELGRKISSAFQRLPLKSQNILNSAIVNGVPQTVIAAQQSQSHAAVRQSLTRAKRLLRKRLLVALAGLLSLLIVASIHRMDDSATAPPERTTANAQALCAPDDIPGDCHCPSPRMWVDDKCMRTVPQQLAEPEPSAPHPARDLQAWLAHPAYDMAPAASAPRSLNDLRPSPSSAPPPETRLCIPLIADLMDSCDGRRRGSTPCRSSTNVSLLASTPNLSLFLRVVYDRGSVLLYGGSSSTVLSLSNFQVRRLNFQRDHILSAKHILIIGRADYPSRMREIEEQILGLASSPGARRGTRDKLIRMQMDAATSLDPILFSGDHAGRIIASSEETTLRLREILRQYYNVDKDTERDLHDQFERSVLVVPLHCELPRGEPRQHRIRSPAR